MRRLLLAVLLVPGLARGESLLDDAARVDPEATALVHHAAVAALLGRVGELDDAARDVRALDESRRERDLAPTGLLDDVRLLAAALRPTRDARRNALDELLDDDPDPVVARIARHALEHEDDAGAADQLLADDRHNRRATLLNDAVRPLGIFSGVAFLAAVNPFIMAGSALDSLVTTAINLYHYDDLSTREREALVRYRRQLSRDARTMDAPEIAALVREINARRSSALCAETVAAAEKALGQDLDRARFYARSASELEGCADRVAPVGAEVAQAVAARAKTAEAARWPADPVVPPSGPGRSDYHALAVATVLGDPAAMLASAETVRRGASGAAAADGAALAGAVARDLVGRRDEAEAVLRDIAGDDTGPGRVAVAMLDTQRFRRLDDLAAAERRHSRDVAQYVLVGGGPDGREAIYTAAQFGAQGLQAAESFGIFNVIGMVTRAWSAWRKDPASNQRIIDEGERFLAHEPDAAEASEVHERLATAYERAGVYDRALMHYRAVDRPDADRLAELEEHVAEQLWKNAEKAGGEPALLAVIVHHFPGTDTAEKARKALESLPGNGEVPLKREVIERHPGLLGPTALDLPATLLDGEDGNGELDDTGITVAPTELVLSLRGDRKERRPLDGEHYARARAAAESALYASALSTDPTAGEAGRFERYIPFFLSGSLGESGAVSVAPGVKLRRDRSEDRALYE